MSIHIKLDLRKDPAKKPDHLHRFAMAVTWVAVLYVVVLILQAILGGGS